MNYALLTNEELARYADLAANPLTTTELEQVLLARFTVLVGENAINAAAVEVLEEFNLDTSLTADIEAIRAALQFAQDYDLPTVRALMDLASEHDIDCAGALKPLLEIADQIANVRDDPTCNGIAVLNKIFNPTTA